MLQDGKTGTDGQPPVSIKASIHQLLHLIFLSHTWPTVNLLFFFTCLGKATHSKLDKARSFEAQKCRALVCSALLPDCVSTRRTQHPFGITASSIFPCLSRSLFSLLCPFTSSFSHSVSLHRIGEMDSVKKQT